jgi:hypothetical protein
VVGLMIGHGIILAIVGGHLIDLFHPRYMGTILISLDLFDYDAFTVPFTTILMTFMVFYSMFWKHSVYPNHLGVG